MARETKVGLLIGLGVILLVGIIISDHLAVTRPQTAEAAGTAGVTGFAQQAQEGIHPTAAPAEAGSPAGPSTTPEREPAPSRNSSPRLIESDRFTEPELSPPAQRMPETQAAQAPAMLADLPAPPTAWRAVQPEPRADRAGGLTPSAALSSALGAEPAATVAATDPADLPEAAPVPAPHRRTGAELIHYVEANDTLTELASRYYGDSAYQGSIAAVNRGALAADGTLIPGTRLIIPNRAGHATPAPGSADNIGLLTSRLFEAVPGINARGDAPATVLPVTAAARAQAAPQTVEVLPGDSLSKLAERHLGSAARYQELYEANTDQLASPDVVVVGMKLRLPAEAGSPAVPPATNPEPTSAPDAPPARGPVKTYTVQAGDNLSRIAEKALGDRNRWNEVYEANKDRLDSPDTVKVGQELRIPG